MISAERCKEYMDLSSENQNGINLFQCFFKVIFSKILGDKLENGFVHGEIEFRNVNLGYKNKIILKNVSLKIKENKKVAIVGETGVGKSTLLKSLIRIIEVDEDKIYIDGNDIRKICLKDLRKSITVIPVNLFKNSFQFDL